MTLEEEYQNRFDNVLRPLAVRLKEFLKNRVLKNIACVDKIAVRAKSVESFLTKATSRKEDGSPKYDDPLSEIQDQIGARVVVYYKLQVDSVAKILVEHLNSIESRDIVPESESEFGYVGKHFITVVPKDAIPPEVEIDEVPKLFEVQIKTLFEHAWSQANHDLAYKPTKEVTSDHKRRMAFTAAQAWGADVIFSELHDQLCPVVQAQQTDGRDT